MAAAEYFNAAAAAAQRPSQHSPYQQSPFQQPQELHGSPVPNYNLSSGPTGPPGSLPPPQQPGPPPPYQAIQQDNKPSVHFAPSTPPSQQTHPSGPNSGRSSFSHQAPPYQAPPQPGQYLQPAPHHSPYAQHNLSNLSPQIAAQPPHRRPYMNGNQSEFNISSGYSSDPEDRRRRRYKHHNDREERDLPRERPRKSRSRSTNTDGFLGAAGGGLIGDLIFPGLGTVGGAVAGWLGGKDYGRHRKGREEKLHREQKEWERKFRSRSNSDDRKYDDRKYERDYHDPYRSHPRHRHDY